MGRTPGPFAREPRCEPARQSGSDPVERYVIGVDIGTTAVKAVLLDRELRILAESRSREHPTTYPAGQSSAAEQNPDDWWKGAAAAIREVLEVARAAPSDVAAVGVSSQAPCVVLLDREGRPLRPALIWMDRRSDPQCRDRRAHESFVRARTGNTIDPYYAAAKMAWLLEKEPETARRAERMVLANGYVAFRLTGVCSMDNGHAGLTLLAGTPEVSWEPELLELWGIPARWMPRIAHPTEVVGRVHLDGAAATGLREGTPVVAGLVDAVAASLEAGLSDPGDVCDMTGQSTVINATVPCEVLAKGIGTFATCAYPIPGLCLLLGAMVASGGSCDGSGTSSALWPPVRTFPPRSCRQRSRGRSRRGESASRPWTGWRPKAPRGSHGLALLPYFLGERSPIGTPTPQGAARAVHVHHPRGRGAGDLEGTAYGPDHNLEEMRSLGLRFGRL